MQSPGAEGRIETFLSSEREPSSLPALQLVCPETKLPLREMAIEEAERLISPAGQLVTRTNDIPSPVGRTPQVLVRDDNAVAYPILDGFPILLAPEALLPFGLKRTWNLHDPRYDEAYEEMDFYNAVAQKEALDAPASRFAPHLNAIKTSPSAREHFPEPLPLWLDSKFEAAAQADAYRHISPIRGKTVLQLGGSGLHAVKFLLGSCATACLVSPMVGELQFAFALARHFGIADRLICVAGIGEEIPIADKSFDVVYSGGCVHHMSTEQAFAEISRVLRPGGKFAAIEPWRAPLYSVGTRIFGKREVEVHCRPMTAVRANPMWNVFGEAEVRHHGAISRYPMIALTKLGVKIPASLAWRIMAIDDRICSPIGSLASMGSSVALLGTRAEG
jgi:uncharacterized protein YbaR (Trm112 family)